MRKLSLFSAVLILFLLVPASITWAQVTKTLNGVVRYESGMSETNFSTPNGDVKVDLPQSMSGKLLSGTVSTEPAGKTEKEKNRNLKELLKMVVMLDGQKIPLSATPSIFDWLTHPERNTRTSMELLNVSGAKVAEVSLPPVLSAPSAISPGTAPHLSTSSNVLVKGDMLNVYTDQQFSPGDKFVVTDGKGQQFTIKPVCLSSNQAVITVPDAASPGMCTVSGVFMGIDQISPARFTLVDINLTSPNTNLRPGELSNVLVELNTGTGSSVNYYKDDVIPDLWGVPEQIPIQIRIDLRNLNPNTVTMEGGNLQRVYAATVPETNRENIFSSFQIRRNITGNAVGSFSVSATLHEDYTTSNDPFRPQLNVLKTPEDFNAWANAITEDVSGYIVPGRFWGDINVMPPGFDKKAQRVIDNMPVCTSPEQLDECKAVAYSLLQPLQVPKGAAISWLSSYEALKAAAKDMDTNADGNSALIDYDVLKNGIEFIKRVGNMLKDAVLQTEAANVQQLIEQVQTTAETKENLQDLKNKTNALTAKAGMKIKSDEEIIIKTGMKDIIMASYQLPSLAPPGKPHPVNDLIGFLDPQRKTLVTAPGNDQKVLNEYSAVRLADGHYQVQTVTAYHSPVSLVVSLLHLPQFEIFQMSKKVLDSLMKLKAAVDSLNAAAVRDSTKKGSLVWFELDSTSATWSRIFLDSKCVEIKPADPGICQRDYKYFYDEHGRLSLKPTGTSEKIEYPAVKECLRAKMGQCQEILTYIRKITYYDGMNCNTEVSSHTSGLQFVCK